MIWTTLMKAFWRSDSQQRHYRSVSMVETSWLSDNDANYDDSNDVLSLKEFSKDADVRQPLLSTRDDDVIDDDIGDSVSLREFVRTSVDDISFSLTGLCDQETQFGRELKNVDAQDGNALRPTLPGFPEVEAHLPPVSPGLVSTTSAWSELLNIDTSRRSSDANLSEVSRRMSNVSSSLSEHLRYLVRAFSSRTEKVKETTLQPPSPSSLSDYAASDALSAISTDPQFRRRLDSFLPDQPEGDTISEIVRFREEKEQEKNRKYCLPRWIRRLKFPHVIEPHSKLYLLWLFIVTLAFMYNAWVIPLRAAFPYQTNENLHYWLACDYVCDFIYIVDILLFKMRVSFLNSGMKETHRSMTRANYFRKKIFKFDCMSLLPLDLLYLIEMKVNPWCRLPRLLKIQTFWEFYSRCDHLVRSAHALRILKTFTYMLFLIHIETCGYYAMSVYEGIGSNDWVYNGEGTAYIRCFYLATKTATSIGNNPKPQNTLEYMFMTVYWVSGVFVFALLIGQIRDIVDAANMVKTTYTHRMDNALNYMRNMNLPTESQDRIRTWFIYNWEQQKVIDESKMMDALPMKLRKDLAIHVHFNTLSKVKLFSDCDKTLLYDLVLKLKPILYLPGDYVCKKGEIGKEMYIVSQGVVEVVGGPNNTLVLATLREGSVFGEISLLAISSEGNRRTADVRCKGFTNLFILSKHEFEAAMKDYPDAYKLLKKRAKKLLRMNARIERQSQSSMEMMKIRPTAIIRTPPETPKMVKTVIQMMNPESTLVRRLSSRHNSNTQSEGHCTNKTDSTDSGNDNRAYEPDGEASKKNSQDYPDAEVFYDDILSSRDWSDVKLEDENEAKECDVIGDDEIFDGDVQSEASLMLKDQEDFEEVSGDSGDILPDVEKDDDDDSSPTLDGYNYIRSNTSLSGGSSGPVPLELPLSMERNTIQYTADMFGDIESQATSKMSSATGSHRGVPSETAAPLSATKRSCLSRSIRDDEYAQSLANGFTIIIDTVDDIDGFSNDEMGEDDAGGTGDRTKTNRLSQRPPSRIGSADSISKTVTFQVEHEGKTDINKDTSEQQVKCRDEFKDTCDEGDTLEHDIADILGGESEDTSGESAVASNNSSTGSNSVQSNKSVSKKKTPPKPVAPGKSKLANKNKYGLKLKIEPETPPQFAPYLKSATGKSKSQTNKARQMIGMSAKHRNSNGSIPHTAKAANRPPTGNSKDIPRSKTPQNVNGRNSAKSQNGSTKICIESADYVNILDTADVQSNTSDDNMVTCVADIHRERTLTPNVDHAEGEATEMTSQRQRKISVISIGSVLKDGRETLV